MTALPGRQASASDLLLVTSPHSCCVTRTADLSLTSGSETAVSWDDEQWDTDALHSTSTNPTRITLDLDGLWSFDCGGLLSAGTDYSRLYVAIKLGGTRIARLDQRVAGITTPAWTISRKYVCTAGQYVEMSIIQQNAASAARNLTLTGIESPWFSATYLGDGA
jgi:hypothetical protein